uniref:Uncharacterized protein n=2 Tax=Clytia hemisphaerica TaxID=252671 RepID=A0A7M5WT32_9CNID
KTIQRMTDINKDQSTKTEILDFEMMQAVDGHTHHNLIAFFEGRVLKAQERKGGRKPHLDNLLNFTRQAGYRNIYQEDMCYKGGWGFNSISKSHGKWKNIVKGIKKFAIDNTGLTFASCKMIGEIYSKGRNIFSGTGDFCYNGLNYNTYYVRHIAKKLKATPSGLFMFSILCIPHDSGGWRVQGADHGLAEFITEMSQLENTITLLFADHGNTYTRYAGWLDGRHEQFNPHFFAILPGKVIEKIGKASIDALRRNRLRMVTLIDVHHTIKYLVNSSYHNKGILTEVPTYRTCSTLELSKPTYCICKGWRKTEQNNTSFWPFVEFAVGQLNDIISDASAKGLCKRLVPLEFLNPSSLLEGVVTDFSFDVLANPGAGSSNNEERFSFHIRYENHWKLKTLSTKLISYSRISSYNGYQNCSDTKSKDLKLCICDMNLQSGKNLHRLSTPYNLHPVRTDSIFRIKNKDFFLDENIADIDKGYLSLLKRDAYEQQNQTARTSTTFEAINYSFNRTYEVSINITRIDHMKPMDDKGCKGTVKPNSIRYLCTLGRSEISGNATYDYEVKYSLSKKN